MSLQKRSKNVEDYDEYVEKTGEGNRPIPPAQQTRQRREQHFEVSMSTITQLTLEQDGVFTLHPDQHLRLRQHTGSSTTIGSQIKVGIPGEPHPGLNHDMLKRAQKKQCSTVLERWYKDDIHRGSCTQIGWNEETIMAYDKIALEDHSYTATREETSRIGSAR